MKIDKNIVALVTGGASGLGESTVRALVASGARVVIADVNQKQGEKLVAELTPEKTRFFKTDVTNEDSVIQLMASIKEKEQELHILVNCAGVISGGLMIGSKLNTIPTKEMVRVLMINVVGTFNVSKHAALLMHKQNTLNEFNERGVIVHIASIAGFEGQRGQTVYSASKGAVMGMTLPMARDLGKFGIRVVTLAPGPFKTPMGDSIKPDILQGLNDVTALGRIGDPREFADFVIGICCNSYVTGCIYRLDGGIRLPAF